MKKRIFIFLCLVVAAQWSMSGHAGKGTSMGGNIFLLDTYAAAAPSADPQVILNSLKVAKDAIDVDGKVCNRGGRDFVPPVETGAVIKIELKNDPDVQSDPATITLKYHEVKELKPEECIPFTESYRIHDIIPTAQNETGEKCGDTVDKYMIFSIVPIDPCNVYFPKGQDSDSKNNKIVKNVKMNIECTE